MAASAEQIAQLRRMVAELTTTYPDAALAAIIEAHPMRDRYGEPPLTTLGLDNPQWTATYDLNGAAADVWDEKASALAGSYDVNADGANLSRSQLYKHAASRANHYRSRAAAKSAPMLSRRDEAARHLTREDAVYPNFSSLDETSVLDGLSGDET